MKLDDLYKSYDGAIPLAARRAAQFGSAENYARAFACMAAKNFQRRCLETVRALSAWRVAFCYDDVIRVAMLEKLGKILLQSRSSALEALDLSKVAVTAAPASTA